ncbi:hypothetical protein J3E71DRAFT_341851 [Bipolaris maydis]|nr:hypothetical protein J3E71DRAFT_341851 [Bipolaris maydis]
MSPLISDWVELLPDLLFAINSSHNFTMAEILLSFWTASIHAMRFMNQNHALPAASASGYDEHQARAQSHGNTKYDGRATTTHPKTILCLRHGSSETRKRYSVPVNCFTVNVDTLILSQRLPEPNLQDNLSAPTCERKPRRGTYGTTITSQ